MCQNRRLFCAISFIFYLESGNNLKVLRYLYGANLFDRCWVPNTDSQPGPNSSPGSNNKFNGGGACVRGVFGRNLTQMRNWENMLSLRRVLRR